MRTAKERDWEAIQIGGFFVVVIAIAVGVVISATISERTTCGQWADQYEYPYRRQERAICWVSTDGVTWVRLLPRGPEDGGDRRR